MQPEVHRLILENLKPVRQYLRKLTKDPELAEEYLNDVVVKVLDKFHTFRPDSNFKAWMYTIAKFHVFSKNRRKKMFTGVTEEQFQFHCDDKLTVKETQFDMLDIVDTFSKSVRPKDRELLAMVSLGYEISELSEHFNVPEGTIKSRVHRIRRNMEPAVNL